MRKVDLKTGKLEIIFSIFLLLFALEPLFGSVPAADYAVWGLIVLCLVLMVVLMIKDLVKDARGFLSRYTSRSVLSFFTLHSSLNFFLFTYFTVSVIILSIAGVRSAVCSTTPPLTFS